MTLDENFKVRKWSVIQRQQSIVDMIPEQSGNI